MNTNLHFVCQRMALIGLALFLCGLSVPARGQVPVLSGSFEFGPGTANTLGDAVTLSVPARTTVTIGVLLQRNLSGPSGRPVLADVDVSIDVFKADGSLAISQPATASVFNAGVAVPVIPMPGTFTSQRGCPSTWRVRVRTTNAPATRVFGTVTYGFLVPGTVNLDLDGDPVTINAGATINKNLLGHGLTNSSASLITGTGKIRIRAKWHTDPLDLVHFNQFFPLTVSLIRPNGTVAESERGFSQHAPSPFTPRVDFTYTVTAQDAVMAGNWTLRIQSVSNNPKIVGFDIEKALDLNSPIFNSTFLASCASEPAVGSIHPGISKRHLLTASATMKETKRAGDGSGQ